MRMPLEFDFGSILDHFSSKSSSDGTRTFKDAYVSKIDSEAIWNRSDKDFGAILERLRGLG